MLHIIQIIAHALHVSDDGSFVENAATLIAGHYPRDPVALFKISLQAAGDLREYSIPADELLRLFEFIKEILCHDIID